MVAASSPFDASVFIQLSQRNSFKHGANLFHRPPTCIAHRYQAVRHALRQDRLNIVWGHVIAPAQKCLRFGGPRNYDDGMVALPAWLAVPVQAESALA